MVWLINSPKCNSQIYRISLGCPLMDEWIKKMWSMLAIPQREAEEGVLGV
jgi:hypothetical protein